MKKIALVSLLAAAVAMPAVAEDMKKEATPMAAPSAAMNTKASTAITTTGTPAETGAAATDKVNAKEATPAAGMAMGMTKKVELKDGSWAEVMADGSVKVSKDSGKTWMAAPDGTWEAKDGTKITTKAGKKM